ncbi:hypothetical protein [Pedobacter montanisoli]|uniref:DUF2306 domain-containing protein n=1 Tax=Pedobacter montanisoli TaxID=2923277 RepID=A0ABS9ZW44_9SPHI|nr:hypothetical protein [Pedobacter montanisoli]MCJ0742530.1 hypothetical protein [Pedobacter montanisoli]
MGNTNLNNHQNLAFKPTYWVAFLALCMVMGELHEQAHIQTGYWLCGCYGERNFNVWVTCSTCNGNGYIATLAGPLFSYVIYWLCAYRIRYAATTTGKWYAFAVLFATLPFARIFTAITGGGDEKVFIASLIGEYSPTTVQIIAILTVLIFCLPPILIATRQLTGKRKWWYLLALNIGPLLFAMIWQWQIMNKLLAAGILAQPYAGTPLLIWIHFLVMLILFYCLRYKLIPQTKSRLSHSRS